MAAIDTMILTSLGGDAATVSRELAEFAASARALSEDHPRFIDAYPQKWIAVYQGRVRAVGDTLEAVKAAVEAGGIPSEHVIIRYIDRDQKTLFL